jgi:hypothetical protein
MVAHDFAVYAPDLAPCVYVQSNDSADHPCQRLSSIASSLSVPPPTAPSLDERRKNSFNRMLKTGRWAVGASVPSRNESMPLDSLCGPDIQASPCFVAHNNFRNNRANMRLRMVFVGLGNRPKPYIS